MKGGFHGTTPASCCAHCIATKGCKYWTHGTDNMRCWVKTTPKGKQKQWNRSFFILFLFLDNFSGHAEG